MRALSQLGASLVVPALLLGDATLAHARPGQPRVEEPRPSACRRHAAMCCLPDSEPCTRPGPARALLLSLGAVAGAGAAGILFALGDRLANGDPAMLLVGGGAIAGAGALLGVIAGRALGDGPAIDDRVRRETIGFGLLGSGTTVLGERSPPAGALRFGPTLWLDARSRMRLVGEITGLIGAERHVDPRPQVADESIAGPGSRPAAFTRRRLGFTLGLDVAVGLPYPVLRRSGRLGPAEIRYRPEVQFRREWLALGDSGVRIVEHTMLLPLLVGARWHLSPRQRFTFYVGPRFDVVSYSALDGRKLSRGKPNLAPLYGEAWYDLDIPLSEHPRKDGEQRKAKTTAMLTVGYVHSRFTGRGFNFGPVIGFLGPFHAEWTVRVRPRGSKTAAQIGTGVIVGNGLAVTGTIGAVLPDVRTRAAGGSR